MVPMEGLEPTLPNGKEILSLSCLPIPPHRHKHNNKEALEKINYQNHTI